MSVPDSSGPYNFLSRIRFATLFSLLLGCGLPIAPSGWAAPEKPDSQKEVEAVGDQLEYLRNQKKIIAKGNVVITYGEIKMTADYAEVETQTKQAYARGHVVVLRADTLAARGEEVYYDFGDDTGRFPNGRSTEWPWFASGKEVRQIKKGKMSIQGAEVTTCDLERPHYSVRAKEVTVYSGDKIVARNITLHVLGRKVFWWPSLVIPLQKTIESPIQIQPGYSSQDGAYLLTSKGFSIAKPLGGTWHADYRGKRGFGAGVDLDYHFDRLNTNGTIKTYLTQDKNAPQPRLDNPYADREKRERGRITWRHRSDFNPDTYLLSRYYRLADEFFLQDFFEREFRSDVEPTSFINFTHNKDRYGFYAFNQKRMNKFENVIERLPEVRFDWKNSPFFSRRLYYESNTSLANLNQKFSRSALDEHVFRADSFHEWTFPMKWNGIKLTPSANFRETLYSRDRDESEAVARTAFGGAVDLRTHFYRVFDKSWDVWGIEANQLRHVFEPSVRYDSTAHSSVSNEELNKFDSIDSIDDSNRITFGIENRVQTKRMVAGKLQRVDLVSLNTFLAYDFHPDEEYSRGGFSIWTGELQMRPYEWLQYEIRYEYDMIRDKFREFNQDLMARKGRFHVLFGHRLVTKRTFIGAKGNNQFVLDAGVWLNNLWKLGAHIRWDAEDHELEEWQIAATRDLHDFLLDLGYNVRNSDIDNSNKELFFLFRLKAFPQYDLKTGNRASFAEPRIGTTVAGASTLQVQTPEA
jgi:lipopolysaccharide assembly outer membrane protein LptD (OstA)